MTSPPPGSLTLRAKRQYRPDAYNYFVDLTLDNSSSEDARWLVTRAYLQDPLAETFQAELVQACGFESRLVVYYLRALGDTGCYAWLLEAGAVIELEMFAYRAMGDAIGFELWRCEGIQAGDRSLDACFDYPFALSGRTKVPEAHRRVTRATFEQKGVAIELQGSERFTLSL